MYSPEKFGIYTTKMKVVVAMKGFSKVLDLKFKLKFLEKEDDYWNKSNAGKKAQMRQSKECN